MNRTKSPALLAALLLLAMTIFPTAAVAAEGGEFEITLPAGSQVIVLVICILYFLGVLGFDLRNPYPLNRQKAFIVPGVVPEEYRERLEAIPTWDEWDPDSDRWYYRWEDHAEPEGGID